MSADYEGATSAGRRSVLGRAFEILDCFAADSEQSIASLCDQTGLPPATVHRMLANLIEWGAVERSSRGRYLLGRRLWRLGTRVPDVRRLREVARPTLVDLHAATHAAVLLANREEQSIMVADVIAGRSMHHLFAHQSRLNNRRLAPWLAVAAFGEAEDAASAAPSAATGAVDLHWRQEVAQTRRAGFARTRVDAYEWLSAPLFTEEGALRSTVSLVLPAADLRPQVHGRLLTLAAREVSAGLGHRRSAAALASMNATASVS